MANREEMEARSIEMATWLAEDNKSRNAGMVCNPASLTGKYLQIPDVVSISKEHGLSVLVVAKLLRAVGFRIPEGINSWTGYATNWPKWLRAGCREWINASIESGKYGDEWLSVDQCVVSLLKQMPEAGEYVTTRGMRMALEIEGYPTVRRSEGRGIIGYVIK